MTKFYLKQNVVYRGKSYFFPGYVASVDDDGQYVVKAFGDPVTGAYRGMKHIFGPDQLQPYEGDLDSPAVRNRSWQYGYEKGCEYGKKVANEAFRSAQPYGEGFRAGKASAARELEHLGSERMRLAKIVDELNPELDKVREALTASERECNRLTTSINGAQARIDELRGYIKQERAFNVDLEAKLTEYQKLCADLHNGVVGQTTDIRFVFSVNDSSSLVSFVEVEDVKTGQSVDVGRWETSQKYEYLYLTIVGPNPVGSKTIPAFIERSNPDLERQLSSLFRDTTGETEHVGTVAVTTDEPTHYVHCNGAAHFVKEASFFREQGGDTAEGWGRNWRPVVAQSIEEARTLSKGMDWTK